MIQCPALDWTERPAKQQEAVEAVLEDSGIPCRTLQQPQAPGTTGSCNGNIAAICWNCRTYPAGPSKTPSTWTCLTLFRPKIWSICIFCQPQALYYLPIPLHFCGLHQHHHVHHVHHQQHHNYNNNCNNNNNNNNINNNNSNNNNNYNYNYNYNYTTTTTTQQVQLQLQQQKLQLQQLQLQLHNNYNYKTTTGTTIWLQLHYTNYITPQLQLHYATTTTTVAVHHTTSSSCG